MKFDLAKFGTPLAIFAAILAVWYYLRGKSNPAQAIVNNPATNVPGAGINLPGLTQVLYSPGQGGGVGGPPVAAPSIASTVAASMSPLSPNPSVSPSPIPGYLTYNFGPQFALSKLPVAQYMADQAMMSTGKGCGCGGSCGSGGGCNSSCTPKCDLINARFPDGRGTCLTTKINNRLVGKVQRNLQGYSVSESIVPTAPWLGNAVPA